MDIDNQITDGIERFSIIASCLVQSASELERLLEYVEKRCEFDSAGIDSGG